MDAIGDTPKGVSQGKGRATRLLIVYDSTAIRYADPATAAQNNMCCGKAPRMHLLVSNVLGWIETHHPGTMVNMSVVGVGGATTEVLYNACEKDDKLKVGYYDFVITIRNLNEAFNQKCVFVGEKKGE